MTRIITLLAAALFILGMMGSPAFADHDHGLKTGNGDCVVLAADGAEKDVVLPDEAMDNNPNAVHWGPVDRRHPLHVMVHKGKPGTHLAIGVVGLGDDPCPGGNYLNR